MRAVRFLFILSLAACAQQPPPQSAAPPMTRQTIPANATAAPVVMPRGEAPVVPGGAVGAPGVFSDAPSGGGLGSGYNPMDIGAMEQLPQMPTQTSPAFRGGL
jgi:hypothetical protein